LRKAHSECYGLFLLGLGDIGYIIFDGDILCFSCHDEEWLGGAYSSVGRDIDYDVMDEVTGFVVV
jgi:hypothetical protein